MKFKYILVAILVVSGCSFSPVYEKLSDDFGFDVAEVSGDGFQHIVFTKSGSGSVLHIYIEGDGRPWQYKNRVASDPTPKRTLMLELMALDRAPAVYVGRPCYFVKSPSCSPVWWTHRRYSKAVVKSMAAVIDGFTKNYDSIVLMGHSGGGTLAMLLAARLDKVTGVVTLAANLDINKWAEFHGYSPLEGSLSPADMPALPLGIKQFHYAAVNDQNIKTQWLESVLRKHVAANLIEVEGDHGCCWLEKWPEILARVAD